MQDILFIVTEEVWYFHHELYVYSVNFMFFLDKILDVFSFYEQNGQSGHLTKCLIHIGH